MQLNNFYYQKSGIKDWQEVFQNPQPITLETFTTGSVVINRRGTINPKHPRALNVGDELLEVPILSYRIHHEEKGDYLLDSGLDASYYLDPRGGLEGTEVDQFHQRKNQNIAHHLETKGIHLEGVFFSHLHADHTAGQRELPKDILYVVGKGEYEDYRPELNGDFLDGLETLQEIDFSKAGEIPPFGPSVDLWGDGSLWAILTLGHTRGHMSFLVNGYDEPIFLTMDAAFIRENLERRVAPSDYTWDVELAQKTLDKIIEFMKMYPQVRVGPGHEV